MADRGSLVDRPPLTPSLLGDRHLMRPRRGGFPQPREREVVAPALNRHPGLRQPPPRCGCPPHKLTRRCPPRLIPDRLLSAPGAAAGSCASASRSTTSGSRP